MMNNKLVSYINNIYKTKQLLAKERAAKNYSIAMLDSEFSKIENQINELVFDIPLKKVKGLDVKDLERKYITLQKERSAYLKKNKLNLNPQYECKICNDTGYVNNNFCKCTIKHQFAFLESQSVFDKAIDFSFLKSKKLNKLNKKDFPHSAFAYHMFENLCSNLSFDKINYVIQGHAGTGKTYLLSAIYNSLKEKEQLAVFMSASNLFRFFFNYHLEDNNKKDRDIFDLIFSIDYLIIDDIGTESMYQNITKEYLFDLLEARNNRQLITFISTNLSADELLSRYEERIYSRLFHKTNSNVCVLQNDDLRLS